MNKLPARCVVHSVLVLLFMPLLACAQDVQVPFDGTGKVFVITRQLQEQHNFLLVENGFVEASLFRNPEGQHWLEFIYERRDGRERQRVPISVADVLELRERVDKVVVESGLDTIVHKPVPLEARNETRIEGTTDPQSGRTGLLVGTTLWGMVYGPFIVSAADAETEAFVASFFIGGGIGFAIPAVLTSSIAVSDASREMALSGLFQGLGHGLMITGLLFGSEAPSYNVPFALAAAVGVTEAVAGFVHAANTTMSAGRAGAITSTAFFGSVIGGELAAIALSDLNHVSDVAVRLASGLGLAGAVAGIVVGDKLADHYHFTLGDATAYTLTSLYGAALPYFTVLPFVDEPSIWLPAVGLATTALGMYGGLQLVKSQDFRTSDGTGMILGSIAGTLVGFGVASLTNLEEGATPLIYGTSLAGFMLGLALASPSSDGSLMGKLDLLINPLAPFMANNLAPGTQLPVASVTYRF